MQKLITNAYIMSRDILRHGEAQLEQMTTITSPQEQIYAVHVNLLLTANKINTYLKDCASQQFKKRFGLE